MSDSEGIDATYASMPVPPGELESESEAHGHSSGAAHASASGGGGARGSGAAGGGGGADGGGGDEAYAEGGDYGRGELLPCLDTRCRRVFLDARARAQHAARAHAMRLDSSDSSSDARTPPAPQPRASIEESEYG